MKKRFLFLALALALLFILSSCVDQTITADIQKDGGQVTEEVVISKELYSLIVSYEEDTSWRDEVEITTFTADDGLEYVSLSKTETFDSIEEMNEYFATLGESTDENGDNIEDALNSGRYFDYFEIYYSAGSNTIGVTGCFAGYGDEYDEEDYESESAIASFKLILNFPGEITYCDFGTQIDENTVEIDVMDAMQHRAGEEFRIEANAGDSYDWVWIVLGVVVLLLIGGIILLAVAAVVVVIIIVIVVIVIIAKKRKKKKTAKATQDSESSV